MIGFDGTQVVESYEVDFAAVIDRPEEILAERFHVPIVTNPGAFLYCEQEPKHMKDGELWWFNHKSWHHAINAGTEPRIHLIVDALAPRYWRPRGILDGARA